MMNAVAGIRQPQPQQRRGTMPSLGPPLSEGTAQKPNRDAMFQAYVSHTHMQNAPRSAHADAGMTECGGGKHGLSEEQQSYGPTC